MRKVLVTGASGFVGKALCSRLALGNKVIGVYRRNKSVNATNIAWEQADLIDYNAVVDICEKYSPAVVVHCAGLAHQKIGAVDLATHMRVNSEATENLAKVAARCFPDVCFIFLSSISVYGEGPQMASHKGAKAQRWEKDIQIDGTKTNNDNGVGEDSECWPSSDYAVSKLAAERRLIALADEGKLRNLVILRLAPVYDREWSLNLDRRVFAPGKLAYLRFGSGSQRMSALARPNLIDFIVRILQATDYPKLQVFNVCDANPYEFNTIITVFKKSGFYTSRLVLSVPLSVVWLATRIAGALFPNKKNWLHSCYDKLAYDLIFNNENMLGTGFKPIHSLETIMGGRKPETWVWKKGK